MDLEGKGWLPWKPYHKKNQSTKRVRWMYTGLPQVPSRKLPGLFKEYVSKFQGPETTHVAWFPSPYSQFTESIKMWTIKQIMKQRCLFCSITISSTADNLHGGRHLSKSWCRNCQYLLYVKFLLLMCLFETNYLNTISGLFLKLLVHCIFPKHFPSPGKSSTSILHQFQALKKPSMLLFQPLSSPGSPCQIS